MFRLDVPCWSVLFEVIASILLGLGIWRKGIKVRFAMLAFFAVAMIVATVHRGSIDAGAGLDSFHYGTVRVLFGFSVGAILYRHRPAFSAPPVLIAFLLTLALLLPIHSPFYQLLGLLVLLLSLLVYGANARAFKGASMLGQISYPLYIIHVPFLI
jgi:peptidoglycan/LPS O-acetylase OafA/YrhL